MKVATSLSQSMLWRSVKVVSTCADDWGYGGQGGCCRGRGQQCSASPAGDTAHGAWHPEHPCHGMALGGEGVHPRSSTPEETSQSWKASHTRLQAAIFRVLADVHMSVVGQVNPQAVIVQLRVIPGILHACHGSGA